MFSNILSHRIAVSVGNGFKCNRSSLKKNIYDVRSSSVTTNIDSNEDRYEVIDCLDCQ